MQHLNIISEALKYSPIQIFAILLQGVFFAFAITSAFSTFLKILRFSYAQAFANNRLIQAATIFLFVYFQAWGTWGPAFIVWGYLCAIVVSLYAVDCCFNIASSYAKNVRGLYFLQVFLYVNLTMLVPLLLVFRSQPRILFYCLTVEILIIATVNAIRNRHIINSALVSALTLSIPLGRILLPNIVESLFLPNIVESLFLSRLPLQLIPIIMMSLDAEYRERIQAGVTQGSARGEFLKSCIFFLAYAGVNGHTIHIEATIALWALVLTVSGRDNS